MAQLRLFCVIFTLFILSAMVESTKITPTQPTIPSYNITDSMIYATHSSMAYCDKAIVEAWNSKGAKQLQFQDPIYLYDNVTQVAGYIGYRPDTQSIVLSLRGSSNNANWEEDFNV
jgi:hypothetical protein